MKFEVIIPNYNGFNLIKKNLPKVYDVLSYYKDFAITIVDDASESEEVEKLKDFIKNFSREHNKVQVMYHKKNLGFSSSCNSAGLSSKAEYLIFLNTDVVPYDRFLDNVIEQFNNNDDLFGVGCLDESVEHNKIVLRGRGIGGWKKGMLLHAKGNTDKNNTLWISGGSCVVRADMFQQLNGFDELYNPFYWEDIDLSYRAQKRGWKILFIKNSRVKHFHSEGSIKNHYNDELIKTIAYRNQFIFIWKNITDIKLLASHLLYLPYYLLISLLHNNTQLLKGFFYAIKKLFVVLKKRRKLVKTVSDSDILKPYEKEFNQK